jgi:RHS repeat-associated protein
VDEDGDGYGIQGASNCAAGHPEQFDCDDHNNQVYPGSMEIALDGLDNDCNGSVDNLPQDLVTYSWDGNGNMTRAGDKTYTWDARDRLVSTSAGGTYGYDTSNLRTKMGEQKVLLDGIEEAREYGTSEVRYDHDPSRVDGLLAQKAGGVKGYFVTDALGSVYAVVDASGAVVSKYGYDVYGARTATTEGMATGWGFTGRRHDGAGEMYYRERYREMESGLWIVTDPLPVAVIGRYHYVHARPTIAVDSTGKIDVLVSTPLYPFPPVQSQTSDGRKVDFDVGPVEPFETRGIAAEMAASRALHNLVKPDCQAAIQGAFNANHQNPCQRNVAIEIADNVQIRMITKDRSQVNGRLRGAAATDSYQPGKTSITYPVYISAWWLDEGTSFTISNTIIHEMTHIAGEAVHTRWIPRVVAACSSGDMSMAGLL